MLLDELPEKLKGFHIQEIIDCCLRRDKGLMPIELLPRSGPQGDDRWKLIYNDPESRFLAAIKGREGLLIGQWEGKNHAFGWDGYKVFDPNGIIRSVEDIQIKEIWLITLL